MPFFLLSKDSDDRLSLLSAEVFESRAEALSELSRVTSLPEFNEWDDEVLVFELGSGASVLLMRPAAAAAPVEAPDEVAEVAEEVGAEEAEEIESPTATADEPEESPGTEFAEDAAVFEAPDMGSPEPAEPAAQAGEPEATVAAEESEPVPRVEESGPLTEAEENEPVIQAEESEPVTEVDENEPAILVDENEPVTEVDEVWADAVQESEAESDDEVSLREALRKSAIQMESEGIVAPESVGPADEPDGPEETASDNPEEPDGAPSWPWDLRTADPEIPAFSLDALEEPGTDEMSLVRAPGDDDTMSSARPVIMGAYSEPQSTDVSEDSAHGEAPSAAEPDAGASSDLLAEPVVPSGAKADTEISDFILDLEAPDPGSETPGYAGSAGDLGELSCNDCVYVETCPHKEGSDPRTCGSFQWK